MSKKRYYMPGVDEINLLVETPASKEKTDSRRFVITTLIAIIAAVFAIAATIIAIMTYVRI